MQEGSQQYKVVQLRSWGYGYKFTIQTFYPNGDLHRQLACHTSEQGYGLVIAGITVNSNLSWRGLTLKSASEKLTRLLDNNLEWLKLSAYTKRIA